MFFDPCRDADSLWKLRSVAMDDLMSLVLLFLSLPSNVEFMERNGRMGNGSWGIDARSPAPVVFMFVCMIQDRRDSIARESSRHET